MDTEDTGQSTPKPPKHHLVPWFSGGFGVAVSVYSVSSAFGYRRTKVRIE